MYWEGHREEDRRANRPSGTGYAPTDGTDREHLTVPLNKALHGHRAAEAHPATPSPGERKRERLWRLSLLGPTDRRRKHDCDRHERQERKSTSRHYSSSCCMFIAGRSVEVRSPADTEDALTR